MAARRKKWIPRVLLLAVLWVVYYALARVAESGPMLETDQLVLTALSLALVVLSLGLAGMLIRNLVRLVLEHRRGILGSKLRIKLVFFFLALVLLPAIVLFSGSAQVIKQTVEAILRTPVEQLTRGSEIVDQWTQHFEEHGARRARALAAEIDRLMPDAVRGGPELRALLERQLAGEGLQMVRVRVGRRLVAGAEADLDDAGRAELAGQLESLMDRTAAESRPLSRIGRVAGGLVAQAAAPVGGPGRGRPTVVGVANPLPPGIAANAEDIDAAVQSYRQFRTQRRELVRFYVTLIGLIFLATLFVASWVGLFVARRITEPIQEVAAATREISAGNMDVRVNARVGDEMAILVDAFNEMAGELQENRAVISRGTAELRRSNRALDERRRYIETLVANLSTAVLSLDPAGRTTTANPAVETILGFPLRVGDDAASVLRDRGLSALAELLDQDARPDGEPVRRDLELPGAGAVLHVSVQVSPLIGHGGESLGSLIMMEDLSDLLRAQKALAWEEVARRIAHEIKNPLTPIQLAAQRLRKKFFSGAQDLEAVVEECTASIEHEVGGLKRLVDEFSRFARMPEVEPQSVELKRVVDSVVALYRGQPGIDWQIELDPTVGTVHVDPQQIRRALINLVDNAMTVLAGRGSIRIATRAEGPDGAVRIEVADSGPGIAPEDRDKMFSPYFSTKRGGTGLGLAIVHKIVTDHHGTIRVEDNDPRGARFVIELPAAS